MNSSSNLHILLYFTLGISILFKRRYNFSELVSCSHILLKLAKSNIQKINSENKNKLPSRSRKCMILVQPIIYLCFDTGRNLCFNFMELFSFDMVGY